MKYSILVYAFIILSINVNSQEKKQPFSFNNTNYSIENIKANVVQSPDVEYLIQKSKESVKQGSYEKSGISIPVNFSMKNSGKWQNIENNKRIWQLKIKSNGAKAIGLVYENFHIAKGAELYLYNNAKTQVIGPYNYSRNPKTQYFSTQLIQGDEINIEYTEPESFSGISNINIIEVVYVYQNAQVVEKFNPYKDTGWNLSESCEININCSPAGDNWQDEKRGVASIWLRDGSSWGWCTGTLINNTSNDGTPYFLTADHCGGSTASTSDFSVWEFYFNYEASSCTTPTTEPSYDVITGSTKKAVGPIDGGSDFLLLELNSSPSQSINAYYNGWDRTNTAFSSGVGIHHPHGDIKKISAFSSALSSASPNIGGDQTATNSEWEVYWSNTGNGTGVTEGGSSGSPLFNSSGLQIGTLSGGSASCSSTSSPDYYGKFYYHWDQNGTNNSQRLKPWLDPLNTGVSTLSGFDPNISKPVPKFISTSTTVVLGNSVTFTDQSTGNPTAWEWTFEGGNLTTSTTQNPTVTYNTIGTYDVSLKATNSYGDSTIVKTDYITVIEEEIVTCDNITNFVGTPSLYSADGGYLSGNNGYGDVSKAEYFSNYSPYTQIDKFLVGFAVAKGSSSNILFNVRNEINGQPGVIMRYMTLPISSIITATNNYEYVEVDLSSNPNISGPFFLEVVLPTASGDTLALITNVEGEASTNTAWEKWSDGVWYPYSSSSAWDLSLNHDIYAVVCTGTNGEESVILDEKSLTIFPNPVKDLLTLQLKENPKEIQKVEILNNLGQIIYSNEKSGFENQRFEINTAEFSSGIYYINVLSKEKLYVSKFIIEK